MARRHDGEEIGRNSVSRRNCLKAMGVAASSIPMLAAGGGGAAAQEYETITVSAGDVHQITLGSGDTLENVLIDITASRADVAIRASGNDWTIRNVGIRGQSERGRGDVQWAVLWVDGNGTIENVYLGDGCVSGVDRTGIAAQARQHSGHFEVLNCHVARWSDNGIYTAHAVNHAQGTVHLRDCYFRDNNVTHYRVACDGDSVVGCVAHNTGNVPALPNGEVWSRGVFTYYGDPAGRVRIEDCDIDVTSSNTNGRAFAFAGHSSGGGESTTIHVENTEHRGEVTGPSVEFAGGNGNAPDVTPPAGVPMSAEEAASGGGQEDDSGSENGDEDEDETRVITIRDETGWRQVNYEFAVSGDLEKSTDNDATIDDDDIVDGSTATGHVWGGTDSYRFTGEIEEFWVDAPATVLVDGEEVDPGELMGDLPAEDTRVITIHDETGRWHVDYEFSVSGDLERSLDEGATIDEWNVVDGSTASGHVRGWKDSYRFTGEITDFKVDVPVTVLVDGEEVDPADLASDLENMLTIASEDRRVEYEFSVSGDLERSVDMDATIDEWNVVDGSTASGHVSGWRDSYRFSGEIEEFQLSAPATISLDGEEVDPDDL